MKLFFDLDGTLIDSRERLYNLFQCLVPSSELTFDEYWELKKNKMAHPEILKNLFFYSDAEVEKFKTIWLDNIELNKWLDLDKPYDGMNDFLINLKKSCSLYVVTARQFEDKALNQIEKFGWSKMFEKILVTKQKQEKKDLIKTVQGLNSSDWIIGDTGKDIQTGKELGIKTIAVLSGFMNRENLLEYNPDMIFNNVTEISFEGFL